MKAERAGWLVHAAACAAAWLAMLAGCTTLPGTEPAPTAQAAAPAAAPPALPPSPAAAPLPPLEISTTAPPEAPPEERVPAPLDPVNPEVPINIDDKTAHADLWARVRRGFSIPDLDNDLVREREQWYASRPDYVARMAERGSRYLFHIVQELERRSMPTELALLPFIESAFNPEALSSASASGIWQFMPSTGRSLALRQNVFRDDRRDVLASTRAALDYLAKLHDRFGDWYLALAAYNWGEGSVQRAIARNQRLGLPADYEHLQMPNETRYYVPKLQAMKNIVMHPQAFALTLPPLSNHPYFLSVPITRDIDVNLAARLAGIDVAEFKTLNPQMNKPVLLAAGTPQVLLPYDNADRFVHKLSSYRGPLATWTAWVAPKTLRPADAARQVGMSETELREVNHIPPRMLVKAGSTLLVPRNEQRHHADVSVQIADTAMMTLTPDLPSLRRIALRAGKRDSVASIARRYRVSDAQVALWNRVGASASFRPGQTVIVFVAHRTPVRRSAVPPPRRKAAPPATRTPAARPPHRTAG